MDTNGRIPPIIEEVLSSDDGFITAILGLPGTGKSLFVQEILRHFENSSMIVTSSENYSTVANSLRDEIKAFDSRQLLADFHAHPIESFSRDQSLKDQLSQLVGGDESFYSRNIIIIDSWTDFVKSLDTSDEYSVQQSVITAARKEKKKLLLVTEHDWAQHHVSSLHHSADGVIHLEKVRDDQRMYRQIVIEKLRSVPVNQDSFLFTLYGGRFTYIPFYAHQYPPITIERDPIPDASPVHMSTGNASLDDVLSGGFQRAKLSLIEVDNLAVPYLETIYIPFLSNHLQQERPAVILLPEGWSPETFTKSLTQFVDKERVDQQVVFFGRQALGKHLNARAINADPWKTLQEIRYEADVLERKFDHEATELFAMDTLENMYGEKQVRGMVAEISASLSSTKRTTIAIISSEQAIKSESISHHIHLRVREICGVLSVCGANPRTNFLALRPILSGGFLDYELMPIV
jgi:KaiC/GvpD/RAD55 family RecA-like ATPase